MPGTGLKGGGARKVENLCSETFVLYRNNEQCGKGVYGDKEATA